MQQNKIEKKCEENNLTFIGYNNKENKYINNKTKLHIKCNVCGYMWNTTSYDKFVSRPSKCPKCTNKLHITQEEILERIEKRCNELNFTFIGFKDEYSGILKTKLILRCNKCGEEWNTTTINNFLKNDRNSHKCGRKNPIIASSHIKDIEKIIDTVKHIIKDSSMEFVNIKEPYCGVKKCVIVLKCKKCHEIIEYTYYTLKYSKNTIKCKKCEYNGKISHEESVTNIIKKCDTLDYKFLGFNTPNGLYGGKNSKLILMCNKCGHIWNTTTYISFIGKVIKCKNCINSWQLEKEVESILIKHNINFEKQKKFDWLRYKLPLSLDFYLTNSNIFIECQGRQHFMPVDNFGSQNGFEETIKRDKEKYNKCIQHGIRPIYYGNKKKWVKFLNEEIISGEEELIKKILENG